MRLRLLAASLLLATPAAHIAAQEALHFAGSLQHVSIPHDDALTVPDAGTMTLELWVKPPAYGDWHVLGKRASCFDGGMSINYQLLVYTRLSTFVQFNSGTCPTQATGLPGGIWTHVAVVADAAGTTIYEDGVEAGNSACTMTGANTSAFWIGGTTNCEGYFQGDLDEVRLWNIARPQAQIDADRVRIIDPATPGLVGYWRFEEAADSQLVLDSTAHALNGTLGNDTQGTVDDPTRVSSDAPTYEIIFISGFE